MCVYLDRCTCCADFEMATNKKKKFINLKVKIEVVKEFRSGRPVADIAQHFGIGKTQVYRILKNN